MIVRITIIMGPWLPIPPIEGGSTGRIWQGLAERFARDGHHVTIVSKEHPKQVNAEDINGVKYLRIGGGDQTGNIFIDLVKDFFYAIGVLPQLPNADLTIIHDFWLPALIRFRKSALGKTIVFVGRMPKGQFWLYNNIDSFVVASLAVRDKILAEQPTYRDKITLIPLPVEDIFLNTARESGDTFKLLYVGRLHPEKGVHLLINAFVEIHKIYPDATLDIVGPSDKKEGGAGANYLNDLLRSARDLPIKFHEPVYDLSRLKEYYKSSDVFIYPSLADEGETFGLAPLEAMAAGCVPIVSDLACFRGHVKDGVNGLTFRHNGEDSLAALVESLKELKEKDRLIELSHNAASNAKNYSYTSIAAEYYKLFSNL